MTGRAVACALVVAAAFGGAALAQPVTAPIPPLWLGNVPPPGAPAPADPRGRDLLDQTWAMVGREDRIAPDTKPVCAVADVNPVEAIAKLAEKTSIVIVNEAHDSPRDRAFVADLGVRLADLGYDTYAAETFMHGVAADPATPPKLGDGWYSQEPVFGALLRALKRENYRFVAYEDSSAGPSDADFVDAINAREAAQASNLINRIFLANRDAKVLIHVGYAHNDEELRRFPRQFLRPREIAWMARRLKDILGIDPLTVDQTTFAAERPGVCVSGPAGAALPTGRDIHVGHPALTFDRNRPEWRVETGARTVEVPRRLKRDGERIIVEARRFEDPVTAIPVDRVLIDPGEDIPLLLPPGRYKARAFLQDGKVTPDVPVTVRPAPRPPAVTRVSTDDDR
jgi:hypothetical protein